VSYQADASPRLWQLTGNVLPITGAKFQSSGKHCCAS